jgi:hypothetical protein
MKRRDAPLALIVVLVLSFAIWHAAGLILAVLALGGGYLASLRLNPRTRCRRCDGSGRPAGRIWTWTHHKCVRCGGNGRVLRSGAARIGHPSVRAEAARVAAERAAAKRLRGWR